MTTTEIKKSKPGSGDAQSVLRNSMASISAQMANLVANLFSSAIVGRHLGPELFGMFNWALGLCAVVTSIANAGVDNVVIREVARNRSKAPTYLLSALVLKLITAGISYLGILVYLDCRHYSGLQLAVGYLLCSMVIAESLATTCRSVLTGLERQDVAAVVSVLTNLARVAIVIILVYRGYTVIAVSVVTVNIMCATFVANMAMIRRLSPVNWKADLSVSKYLVTVGSSFLLSDLVMKLFDRADYIMLEIYMGVAAVGIYSAAYRIIDIVQMISYSCSLALFPIIAKRILGNEEGYARAITRATKYLAMIGIPLCAGVFLLGKQLMLGLYSDKYAASGTCLALLIWSRVGGFLIAPGQQSVAARNAQLWLFPPVLVRTIINIGMNLYLIPRYGFIGSCWAMIVSENVCYLLNYLIAFRGPERFDPVSLLWRPVAAAGTMALVIRALPSILSPLADICRVAAVQHRGNWLLETLSAGADSRGFVVVVSCVVGAVVYAGMLFILRAFDQEDKRILRALRNRGEPATQSTVTEDVIQL